MSILARLFQPITILLLAFLILWCVIVYMLGGVIAIFGWMAAAVVLAWAISGLWRAQR